MKQNTTDPTNALLLDTLRNRIDEIDLQILSHLASRQLIAKEIGLLKKRMGLDLIDAAREHAVIEYLVKQITPPLTARDVRVIFSEIISAARSIQKSFAVAYLGPEGSFCHQAAIRFFGNASELRSEQSVEDVFSMVEKDRCRMGIVPIENSYQGSVTRTLDLFYEYDLKIQGEIFLRIRHQLLSRQDNKEKIRYVYSHPMALAQCRAWLKENMPGVEIIETGSTSEAARQVSTREEAAAIGNEVASRIYDLKVLEQDIEDRHDNVTRFLVIGKGSPERSVKNKTSLLFSLPHTAGTLNGAISPLAQNGINMTRIESRPAKGMKWAYLFFVDIEGHKEDDNVAHALREMEKACSYFKYLGSYPTGGEPWN